MSLVSPVYFIIDQLASKVMQYLPFFFNEVSYSNKWCISKSYVQISRIANSDQNKQGRTQPSVLLINASETWHSFQHNFIHSLNIHLTQVRTHIQVQQNVSVRMLTNNMLSRTLSSSKSAIFLPRPSCIAPSCSTAHVMVVGMCTRQCEPRAVPKLWGGILKSFVTPSSSLSSS